MLHRAVERLELALLPGHVLHLLQGLLHGLRGLAVLPLLHLLGTLPELVGQVLQGFHLRALLLELLDFVFELAGGGRVARLVHLIGTLLQVGLGVLGLLGHLVDLLLELFELFGQLFLLGGIELAVGQFLLEFLEGLGGLLEIALGKRLGQLVGGAAGDVLDLFHLPLEGLAAAAELLPPLLQLAGEVVQFDEGLFALRLGLEFLRPFFQPLEEFRGVFEALFFGLLAALGQLLPQVVGRLLHFQRRLRGGRVRGLRLRSSSWAEGRS